MIGDEWTLVIKDPAGIILGSFSAIEDTLPTPEEIVHSELFGKTVLILTPRPESRYTFSGTIYEMLAYQHSILLASRKFTVDYSWGTCSKVEDGQRERCCAAFRKRDLIASRCTCGSWVAYGRDADLCADWCDTNV
jgi:hypothetical protein